MTVLEEMENRKLLKNNNTTFKDMQATDRHIQLFITTKDISDRVGFNRIIVNNGLLGLFDIIPIIHFNGEEAIYVHLSEPIPDTEAYKIIFQWCDELKRRGMVNHAEIKKLAIPSSGDVLHLTLDVNNNLIENRYLIVFNV